MLISEQLKLRRSSLLQPRYRTLATLTWLGIDVQKKKSTTKNNFITEVVSREKNNFPVLQLHKNNLQEYNSIEVTQSINNFSSESKLVTSVQNARADL